MLCKGFGGHLQSGENLPNVNHDFQVWSGEMFCMIFTVKQNTALIMDGTGENFGRGFSRPRIRSLTHSFFLKHNFCQVFSDFPRILVFRVQLSKKGVFGKSYLKNFFVKIVSLRPNCKPFEKLDENFSLIGS